MSGGHYEYAYSGVDSVAEQVRQEAYTIPVYNSDGSENFASRCTQETQDRLAMSETLSRVALAMRRLEWYDSGDSRDWEQVKQAFKEISKG